MSKSTTPEDLRESLSWAVRDSFRGDLKIDREKLEDRVETYGKIMNIPESIQAEVIDELSNKYGIEK